MNSKIGYSVFPSTWVEQKIHLEELYHDGSAIFTSLHISEEFDQNYTKNAMEMLTFCKQIGYQIIADISPRTLTMFDCDSISELNRKLPIDIVRIDFGFTLNEVLEASETVPICLNASTLSQDWLLAIKKTNRKFFAMHNYYPRPETGLDNLQFDERNLRLREYNIEIMAFIPGDLKKRGPIYEGLPTLEAHRFLLPYVSFVQMTLKHDIAWVFVGDGMISQNQAKLITHLIMEDTFIIPTVFEKDLPNNLSVLFEKNYTVRPDSPATLIRFQESRVYATQGEIIKPHHCISRKKGTLTIDNENYGRYSGEIQITRTDLPKDERVNVLGHVPSAYFSVLDALPNGSKFNITTEAT